MGIDFLCVKINLSHKQSHRVTDDLRYITYYIIYTLTRIENVLIYASFFFVLLRKNIILPVKDRYYQLINVFMRKKAKVCEFFSCYHMIFIFFPAEAMLQGRGLIWKIQRTNSQLSSKSEKFTVTSFP